MRKSFFRETAAASKDAYDVDENGNVAMRTVVTHLDSSGCPVDTTTVSSVATSSNDAFTNPLFDPSHG